MTLLPFPDRPALDDVHEGYIFDGTKWICIPTDGGGGGALPNIPPYTLFGNNMATTGQPVALNGAEATALLTTFDATDQGLVPAPGAADPGTNVLLSSGVWGNAAAVIGTFPTAQPGLVPAPGTASTNSALLASGLWRPPLSRWTAVSADYAATPNDDVVLVGQLTGPITITVPPSNGALTAQQFRVIIRDISFPITFQSPAGDTYNFWMYDRVLLNYSNYVTTFTIPAPATTEILFINQGGGGGWWVMNQGLPKQITSTAPNLILPGVVPNPPAGSPSNAALQANMTWKVPGTNVVDATTSYTVLPTDDVINFASIAASTNLTLTLPALSTVPPGKQIRVIIRNQGTGSSLTLVPIAPDTIRFLQVDGFAGTFAAPLTIPMTRLAVSTGANLRPGDFSLIAGRGDAWYVENNGLPVISTYDSSVAALAGKVSPPPLGTADNAALQADLTWAVPGTNSVAVTTNYTIPATVDWVTTSPSPTLTGTDITWTLPNPSTVPVGKVIRLNVYNLEAGATFTIASPTGNFWFMTPNGEWGSDAYYTFAGPAGLNLYVIARSYGWFLINEGQAALVQSAAGPRQLIGGVPAPPPGTPATAVLHADMTWY